MFEITTMVYSLMKGGGIGLSGCCGPGGGCLLDFRLGIRAFGSELQGFGL